MSRSDGRKPYQLRPISLSKNIFEYANGSVLFALGKTKVLCSVTRNEGVPAFLRGKGEGWLTAEYALLPASTVVRTPREQIVGKRNSRSVEIARLIGRVFRCVVDLKSLGECTIVIDCDVLQADGSTRCAAICGAQAALNLAVHRWLESGVIKKSILKTQIAAVSVGSSNKDMLLDLDAAEDNNVQGDFNFVLTVDNDIIEIQGTAELAPVSWREFNHMRRLAYKGVKKLCSFIAKQTKPVLQN